MFEHDCRDPAQHKTHSSQNPNHRPREADAHHEPPRHFEHPPTQWHNHPMNLSHFTADHLPADLRAVSQPIGDLARDLDKSLPDCAEKTAGMRKLLEAKDCFVRAAIEARQEDPS